MLQEIVLEIATEPVMVPAVTVGLALAVAGNAAYIWRVSRRTRAGAR